MKRRTNLFYTDGPDSKFLTFSNYTEALTGHFLSTYTKLYPSRFLCCYIPDIDVNKPIIIKSLIKYYESKLAFLRDYFDGQSRSKANDILLPLNYLLDCLTSSVDGFEVRAINEITEQDYNGTYTDTICIVNLDSIVSTELGYNGDDKPTDTTEDDASYIEYNGDGTRLYGWTEQELSNPEWAGLETEFDYTNSGKPMYSTSYSNFVTVTDNSAVKDELVFNCIIPLFDLVDTNYVTNNISLTELSKDSSELPATGVINVPYGIWFGNDIVLKRDKVSGFAPTWSLSIASQFKPFPYSKQMPSEARNSEITNSFATFAQVLSQIAALSNKVDTLSSQLMDVNTRIDNITAQTSSQTALDNVQKTLMGNFKDLKENNQRQLDEFRTILDTLHWNLDTATIN
nr:MAG TPA: hypothetical protein [Caudoviricetes sp.]